MENIIDSGELIIILLGSMLSFLIIGSIVYYLCDYYEEIRCVKREIKRADEWDEYVYWKRELHTLYWCLIPFVTPKLVKKARRYFLSRRRFKSSDSLNSMILPSVIGIAVCSICLAGSTFAWFTANRSVSTPIITSANYQITAALNGVIADNFELKANEEYNLTLDASSSTATTGYCALRFGNTEPYTEIYTVQINNNDKITVKIKSDVDTDLQIISEWGTASDKAERLADGREYIYSETE